MRFKSIALTVICITLLLACSEQRKTIELPLQQQNGYGYFNASLGAMSTYTDRENDGWRKSYLSVTGAPKSWSEITYGDIETNVYQSVYQNFLLGNFTKEEFEGIKKSWQWEPDTLQLSKEPIKTKIAFAYGKDSAGVVNVIVDANNNLDVSDDKSFKPFNLFPGGKINMDSVALNNTINVSFEKFVGNKKQWVTAPALIAYVSLANMFMCNFVQYSTAEFNGEKIAVCSGGFTDLSYKDPLILLVNDSMKQGDKISNDRLTMKNEYIEIKGEIYKNRGVNINNNTLLLEKMDLPRSEINSTQIGFHSFAFEGSDLKSQTKISSAQLNGKYVFLDFWAVGCKPCREEIPNMKAVYEKTDRKKFEIVGIVSESDPEDLKKLMEKNSITWPQVLSTDENKIRETFGVVGYPTSFLIDPDGIIVGKNLRGKELEDKVLALINK
jgi:thiol-disulfide isomerase/thioredoxin